jgi:membrane protease YdiL (CAAX protease family)
MKTYAALVLVSFCSIAFVQVSRRGERSVVDEAAGRPVFLLALWGIALSAAVTLLASPASVWGFRAGDLGVANLALIALGWGVVVFVVGRLIDYGTSPDRETLLGSLIGWVLVEEFLFRGALFDLVDRVAADASWDVAIVVTALLFAVSHLQYHAFKLRESALQIAYVVPTGLLFGFVRRETGSIWAPVLLHGLANAISNFTGPTPFRRTSARRSGPRPPSRRS